ncbi:FmdE family protein [Clostridium sp. MT-14]|uniref:FmdE family protein n=1 Tax=Clostridium aromativorans TaxID=2836848 RepID=A0ABS8N5A0_9CLOT|nr:FmdE family protein [Clostridium aromativorans]MCC9294986.1 FmdE family protein [Clostridium aromativorans]
MNENLWNRCVVFHGHECPGLAIGFRVCEAVVKEMNIEFSHDEEIVCVCENDSCAVDAVQVITGCTFGKGNLIYRGTGKMAFSFFNRQNGDNVRIVSKPSKVKMNKEERQRYILKAPIEDIFCIKKPHFKIPEAARIFKTVTCEKCGEGVSENKIRLENGKKVCLDCFHEYSRGW